MYGFSFIMVLFLALTTTVTTNTRVAAEQYTNATVAFAAGQLPAYGLYVEAYARANPAATGEVDIADITIPTWFLAAPTLRNYVTAGAAYVYVIPQTAAEAASIARLIRSGERGDLVRCGIATAGKLQYPGAGLPTITLPAAIPEGALVMVM